MSDIVPHFDLGLTIAGEPVVMVGEAGDDARDMATLLRLAPGVALPVHARDAAILANHLANGGEYHVIMDPAAFEQAYRARLASEDPSAPWQEGVVRLCDFGLPDFGQITPPRFEGNALIYFADDKVLGVPYKVELADLRAVADYKPMPLTPLPDVPAPRASPGPHRPEPPPPLPPPTPEEEEKRSTHRPADLPPPGP